MHTSLMDHLKSIYQIILEKSRATLYSMTQRVDDSIGLTSHNPACRFLKPRAIKILPIDLYTAAQKSSQIDLLPLLYFINTAV